MTASVLGRIDWRLNRDKEGHRDYTIKWLISSHRNDGPERAIFATGLPAIGAYWAFGNDTDLWAFCQPQCKVQPLGTKQQPGTFWTVEQTFSTRPLSRCQDQSIDNPLSEPDRISGSFTKYTREAVVDRDGDPILTSSHEQVRGSAVEMDDNRPNVRIEKSVLSLPLSTFSPMIDTLNDAALWGVDARCIKLSNTSWSRQLYGTCTFFYTVTYEFDVNVNDDGTSGFDKELLDEGTKVLAPGGDKDTPEDFDTYKGKRDKENQRVILDGEGAAWTGPPAEPGKIAFEPYAESNFLTLGIPTSL
jgi:hypothetical protein